MAFYVNATAAGQGHATIGLFGPSGDVYAQLVTLGDWGRAAGVSPVRRLHQAGWLGIGYAADGIYTAYVNWASFIEYEAIDLHIAGVGAYIGTELWWDMSPGTVFYVELN